MVAAEDFIEAGAEEGFTGVEASTPGATLGIAADTTTADIMAATMEDRAITEVAAVMAGVTAEAEGFGAEDTVTDGDGGLASVGRTGVGDIRMATTTTRGITPPALTILTRIIRIRILTRGTTILHRQNLTQRPSPTRKFPSNPGDPRHRETQSMLTTQTARSRPLHHVGRLSPLTGGG
jgi:hypothetical protein